MSTRIALDFHLTSKPRGLERDAWRTTCNWIVRQYKDCGFLSISQEGNQNPSSGSSSLAPHNEGVHLRQSQSSRYDGETFLGVHCPVSFLIVDIDVDILRVLRVVDTREFYGSHGHGLRGTKPLFLFSVYHRSFPACHRGIVTLLRWNPSARAKGLKEPE